MHLLDIRGNIQPGEENHAVGLHVVCKHSLTASSMLTSLYTIIASLFLQDVSALSLSLQCWFRSLLVSPVRGWQQFSRPLVCTAASYHPSSAIPNVTRLLGDGDARREPAARGHLRCLEALSRNTPTDVVPSEQPNVDHEHGLSHAQYRDAHPKPG